MKKVFILGGAGFIGYNLTKFLSKYRNYKITIGDNFARGQMDDYLSLLIEKYNISVIEGDYTDPTIFNKLEKDYDYFYMLASVVGVNNTLEIPHEIIRINSLLIINTLEYLKKSNVKKTLFTSTSENYAGTIDNFGYQIPTPENIPLCISDISHPRFTYAVTKMLGESGFLNYSKIIGFETTIVRYHNIYGPRMGFKHVIPHLAQRFLENETPFKVYGHNQTRAFCYIDDAIKGTVQAMESNKTNGEIFHIGTEEEVSIKELISKAGKFFKYSGEYENANTYPGSTKRRCPDISKAKKIFNYNPQVSLEEGLSKTLKWYESFFNSGENTFEKSFEEPNYNNV